MNTETEEKDFGDIPFEGADDANIPVNIFISEEPDENGYWELTADNFCPRKVVAYEGVYKYRAKTKAALYKVIEDHVLPLYEMAVFKLKRMSKGLEDSFYYWS